MAKSIDNTGTEGADLAQSTKSSAAKRATKAGDNEWQDCGEETQFRTQGHYAVLTRPCGKGWKDYEAAIAACERAVDPLRVVCATVPLDAAPMFHNSLFAGYGVLKGDEFSLKLNDGTMIHAE